MIIVTVRRVGEIAWKGKPRYAVDRIHLHISLLSHLLLDEALSTQVKRERGRERGMLLEIDSKFNNKIPTHFRPPRPHRIHHPLLHYPLS